MSNGYSSFASSASSLSSIRQIHPHHLPIFFGRLLLISQLLLLPFVDQLHGADVFTAMVDLENLLINEAATTANMIEEYIRTEQKRLDKLRQIAEKYAAAIAEPDMWEYGQGYMTPGQIDKTAIMNPVSAYLLIKRLSRDWKQIRRLMSNNAADQFIKNITDGRLANSVNYPDDEDLKGAAMGLLRLQETYQLETGDLANGYVGGESVGRGLNAQDCFEIGRAAYKQTDYFYTLEWMNAAMEREPSKELQIDIAENLAYALYKQGNLKRAMAMTKKLVQMAPDHPRANGNLKWYVERMSAEELANLDDLSDLINERHKDTPERKEYKRLCRGDVTAANLSKLYCYLKMDTPFLKLAPLRVEIIRYEPLVVLFRDVISDPEIAVVKRLATPRLRRSQAGNANNETKFSSYRISKSAWLKDEDDPIIERINRRIHDMTNLEMETAEALQVANYGIGGHYDPHFDFFTPGEKDTYDKKGNRIATVLFYMSQPSNGGFTVYTDLGMGIAPSIHDALFWYNLHRDGEGDMRTRHAACPVLTGVKWIANKWIHEGGQELIRPCPLKRGTNEMFVGDTRPF